MKQGQQLSPLLSDIVMDILATAIRHEKEIKVVKLGKEEIKLFLFPDGMIYLENARQSAKILIETINTVNKVSCYKINLQKSTEFLYIIILKTQEAIIEKEIPISSTNKMHKISRDEKYTRTRDHY